jgi:hypothetical protein
VLLRGEVELSSKQYQMTKRSKVQNNLAVRFSHAERHLRRLGKVASLEEERK